MSIFAHMVYEICEYCGNKFDKRGIGKHRVSCRKRKEKELEAVEKHKGKAAQDAQIRELLEKAKKLEHMIDDLASQIVELIKEAE